MDKVLKYIVNLSKAIIASLALAVLVIPVVSLVIAVFSVAVLIKGILGKGIDLEAAVGKLKNEYEA